MQSDSNTHNNADGHRDDNLCRDDNHVNSLAATIAIAKAKEIKIVTKIAIVIVIVTSTSIAIVKVIATTIDIVTTIAIAIATAIVMMTKT